MEKRGVEKLMILKLKAREEIAVNVAAVFLTVKAKLSQLCGKALWYTSEWLGVIFLRMQKEKIGFEITHLK